MSATTVSSAVAESRSAAVERIFVDCLFRKTEVPGDGSVPANAILPTPIVHRVGLHPDRITAHRSEIASLLLGFPEEFYSDGGGGWSFLNLCMLANGEQWTGYHLVMEQLLQLGEAIGRVSYPMPRDMWDVMPGGMPYVVIDRSAIEGAAS
jgi:hypothetical protein